MKHMRSSDMGTAHKEQGYMADWDTVADLDAWEGYEYWSTRLEAEMESLDEPGMPSIFGAAQLERREATRDVIPF
jgi:hypothetical protein